MTVTLDQALVRYDRLQSGKRHYNPYALGIYLRRADEVRADYVKGTPLAEALTRGFTDRLRDYLLRNVDSL